MQLAFENIGASRLAPIFSEVKPTLTSDLRPNEQKLPVAAPLEHDLDPAIIGIADLPFEEALSVISDFDPGLRVQIIEQLPVTKAIKEKFKRSLL
jgi:hypothetical protein